MYVSFSDNFLSHAGRLVMFLNYLSRNLAGTKLEIHIVAVYDEYQREKAPWKRSVPYILPAKNVSVFSDADLEEYERWEVMRT